MLKIGSEGEDVKKLQSLLGVKADGKFGKGTETALKIWQKNNGLKDDGIAGPATLEKMSPTKIVLEGGEIPFPFNLSKLKGHVPDNVISQIPDTASKFNITTPLRLAHFLAQCAHESGGFRSVVENLNYSADGLKKIFPKYFPGSLNESYAKNPQKIGSRVYGGRMGNGIESTGEGYKYRGRGYIQLTGKSNYTRFANFIGEDVVNDPDLVATKYPLASAAFFFDSNKIWDICDRGPGDDVVTAVTKRVNGGTIGLPDRIKHFKEYYGLLV
jgi:putative chitinase